jgi:peptidoglycan/xylan/chitin deacetylase (PgdA/CDA1 family)
MMGMRELVARVATFPPVLRAVQKVLRGRGLTILTYHGIGEGDGSDPDAGTFSASFTELEGQIAWLRDHVRVFGGEEVAAFVRGELALDGPAVCLTFDDAYQEHLAVGELLARFRLPAVFFVVTDYVGTAAVPDWSPIARASEQLAARPRWLSWDGVRKLRSLGHTIGSHTRSHRMLSKLSAAEQHDELAESRRRLEGELGAPVKLLAYPYGSPETFDAETRRLAAASGYQAAFSYYGGANRAGAVEPFDVRRVSVVRSRAIFRFRSAFPRPYLLKRS